MELKHLSSYLPYGFKVKFKDQIGIVEGIDKSNLIIKYNDLIFVKHYNLVKPILRPLSDLTANEVSEIPIIIGGLSSFGILNRIIIKPFYHSNGYMLQYLFKNHYDVFGLIEKGEAVDINEL